MIFHCLTGFREIKVLIRRFFSCFVAGKHFSGFYRAFRSDRRITRRLIITNNGRGGGRHPEIPIEQFYSFYTKNYQTNAANQTATCYENPGLGSGIIIMWISHSGPAEPSSHAKMQFSGAISLCFKTCHLHAMRIQNLERDDNVPRSRSFDHRCFANLFNNSIVRSFTVSIAFRSQCGGFFFNSLLCTRSKRWRIPFRRHFCRPETSTRTRTRSNRETSWFNRTNRLPLTWPGITRTTREKFKSKFGWMAAWSPCNNFPIQHRAHPVPAKQRWPTTNPTAAWTEESRDFTHHRQAGADPASIRQAG